MANLSDAIARVCEDYLVRPEDEVGDTVGREIQAAIDHYASERFGFNERRLYFTLTNTSVYSLPEIIAANQTRIQRVEGRSDNPSTISYYEQYYRRIIEVDDVITTQSGNLVMLEPVSWDEMCRYRREHTALNTTQGNGTTMVPTIYGNPSLYTVYGDALWLDISPQTQAAAGWSLTAYVDCHVEFSVLSEVSPQTNPFLDEGYDLICARAARMVAMKKLREYDHAAQFANLEGEALNALRERGHRRMATGRLVPRL